MATRSCLIPKPLARRSLAALCVAAGYLSILGRVLGISRLILSLNLGS